jgi:pimeloyl-ACP methyl ester carboxylesterase
MIAGMTDEMLETARDEVTEHRLTRPDGRTVAWTECGTGTPVLRVPGTPGSRWTIRTDRSIWHERGLRMITTERPGWGASSRLPGRGFAEHADDLAAILDETGVDDVVVIGASGAAPHILAFAGRHPDRVRAATIMVGAAPVEDDEIDQMIELNTRAQRLARAGDVEGLRALLSPLRDAWVIDPLAGIRQALATAPASDQEVMADPKWQQGFERATREAFAQGVDGWLDETLALTGPWSDIDLSAVRCTVAWYHGPHDKNAPLSAAQRLVAKLPTARLTIWENAGHLETYHREAEVLDELLSRG